jgi:predicted N-formylglutamate amidohydrolase
MQQHATPAHLLGAGDPAPVTTHNAAGRAPLLVLCDHASNAVPASLAMLGLGPAALSRHIGWDIGAAAVARALAEMLDAPALISGFSRLVIDCNRSLADPTSIPAHSDGIAVPGNAGLGGADRLARAEACFRPYHHAIAARLDAFATGGIVPAIVSIHSFTPRMNGFDRPWQVGVLWDRDPRIPLPLIAALAGQGLAVGDNEPYSARAPEGFTLRRHADARGLPHVLVEIRQDEIGEAAGAARYAALLAEALQPILADPLLYRTAFYDAAVSE